jgi:putative ABC transport system permease protein
MIQVSVRDGASTDKAKQDIERLMRERRHLAPSDEDNFNVMDMKEIATMLTGTTKMLTALLSAVAAVSLLVGGIGIMNIMLVSVTERTREIGIRLAIGAHGSDVMIQFLVESTLITLLGGAVGTAAGFAGARLLGHFTGWGTAVSPATVVVALVFSAVVGIFFGFYPARKAAGLNPIDALRYE